MQEIKDPRCKKVAFYLPAIPIGRPILTIDAVTENGLPASTGNVIECVSCGNKVDLDKVNKYYAE